MEYLVFAGIVLFYTLFFGIAAKFNKEEAKEWMMKKKEDFYTAQKRLQH